MKNAFRIRWNQFLEEAAEHSIPDAFRKALRTYVQVNRIVVPVYVDLRTVRQAGTADETASFTFLVVNRANADACASMYRTRSRRLKEEANVGSGYYAYAVVSDGEIIGDIWCSPVVTAEPGMLHPDLEWLGIRCGKDEAYMFDMYVAPEFRGNAITNYLLGSALNHLKENGYGRVYGFYEKNNLPALWIHRIFGYKELARRKITRLPFYRKSEEMPPAILSQQHPGLKERVAVPSEESHDT